MTSKEKHYTDIIDDARIDFRFIVEDGKVRHFSINLSVIEGENISDVFRVDTAHQGLHFQKFWISPEPQYIEKTRKDDYSHELNFWKREVLENFQSWIKAYKEKEKRN